MRALRNFFHRFVRVPEDTRSLAMTSGREAPAIRRRQKLILLGMMTRHPVAGIVWLTMQHVLGLERLGYEVYYIEAHGGTPKSFMHGQDDGSVAAAAFLDRIFRHFGLADRWAYQAFHSDGRC